MTAHAHLTPGIYRLPKPSDRTGVALVRTDVAGFVGFAERGPIRTDTLPVNPAALAVKIESWAEFLSVFGGPIVNGYLAYAVRGFFANGGRRCYVVRVAAGSDAKLPPADRPVVAGIALPSAGGRGTGVGLVAGFHGVGVQTLDLAAALAAGPGDLVAVEGDGFREFATVADVPSPTTIRLAQPLSAELTAAGAANVLVVPYASALRVRAIAPVVLEFATDGAATAYEGRTADSPGSWGNRIRLDIAPLPSVTATPGVVEFALRVTVEPGADTTRPMEEEYYRRVSLDPASRYYALKIVNDASRLIGLTISDGAMNAGLDLTDGPLAKQTPRSGLAGIGAGARAVGSTQPGGVRSVRLQGGQDGVSGVLTQDFTGGLDDLRGLRLLEEVSEVAVLVCPDASFAPPAVVLIPQPPVPVPCSGAAGASTTAAPVVASVADPTGVPPKTDTVAVYRAALDQCERLRDRVVVIDPPDGLAVPDPNERPGQAARSPYGSAFVASSAAVFRTVTDWRALFASAFGALYYPWVAVADPLGVQGPLRRVPPGGHVAGVYAQTDTLFGVQRPPANVELEDVVDVAVEVNSTQQELLNPDGVNALRAFPGRGIRVWGARSLEPFDERWTFIHVRRLMSMIEKSVDLSSRWAVFEPNDFALRATLVHCLTVFLEAIWQTGGLDGATASQAFYVKCDETNNPPEVVDVGQVICQVGVAPVAPMEFIDFEIRQSPDGSQVVET
jgi:hypothetical protein